MQREKFSSRLGFLLISAGCAIDWGLFRVSLYYGKYGGAAFVLLYPGVLADFGVADCGYGVFGRPGQSAQRGDLLDVLEPKGKQVALS